MQLFDIQEPEERKKKESKENDIAVGIDLGTTNSLIAYSSEGKLSVFDDEYGHKKIKSLVKFCDDGVIKTGNDAIMTSEEQDTGVIISSIKKLMGKDINDKESVPHLKDFIISSDNASSYLKLKVNNRVITPVEISSYILRKLKDIAENSLGKIVKKAVITVPAYFDDAQRQATLQAAKLANLDVLRIINEPTSAALAYGIHNKKEGLYLVYDLGGGTFDVSILKLHKGIFRVLAVGGNTNLGGDNIDYLIAQKIKEKAGDLNLSLSYLKNKACEVKESLSYKASAKVVLEVDSKNVEIYFSQKEINDLICPLVNKTINITQDVMEDSEITSHEIQAIVCVGGSTRIPLIKERLKECFTKQIPIHDKLNPDEIVVKGAAIQAENLTKGSSNLLLDVTPLSIGVELMGGIVDRIINRNTTIPASVSKEFTTYENGQTGINLHIVQGERELAKDCRSLAKLDIRDLPPMNAGVIKLKVTFTIDADGMLTVTAEEKITNTKQMLEVIPSYGLSEVDVENMLKESIKYSYEDIENRLFTESVVNAKKITMQVFDAVNEDKELLSTKEREGILAKIDDINKYIKARDRQSIDNAVNQLDKLTTKFISNRIEKYVNIALKGSSVDDVDKLMITEKG